MESNERIEETSKIVSAQEPAIEAPGCSRTKKLEESLERKVFLFEALLRLVEKLGTTFDIDRIMKLFLMTLAGQLGLRKIAVYLASPVDSTFRFSHELGAGSASLPEAICGVSPFVRWLERENGVVFIDKYFASLQDSSESDFLFLSGVSDKGFSHACPVENSGDRLGILFFSGKANGRAFTDFDTEFLEMIVRVAAITIRNASIYQKAARYMKRAEEFARVRREFILGNSEELRTPLSVMKSSLWSMDTGDAGAGILVDMAKDAVTRMESKLDQLLSLCDVDMNETPLALEKMDAASLVEETMKAFIPELEEKGIMVRINDRSAGTEIFMDPSKIKIVLGNIVENSIRAVDRGGRIEMDIFLSGTGPGSQDGIELLPWNSDAFPAPGEGAIREAFHGYPELDAISKEISFQ